MNHVTPRALLLSLSFIVLLSFGPLTAQFSHQAAVDSIFSEWDADDAPGCALGIIQDGELVYARGYGMANLEYDIPNSSESVFRIGSTSKQFTAACIVLLSQEGKLSLDDPLSKFFPDFPAYADTITVLNLLNHTSGVRDYLQLSYLKGLVGDAWYSDDDVMTWLVNQTDLNFRPGAEYIYSNSGYWLLGQIVEEASGQNMADYAQEKIFGPLEMDNTHFHNDHNRIVKNRASGYAPKEDGGYEISMTTLNMIGDGGIFTSIDDILIWDNAFYSSDVLNQDFWETMTTKGVLNNGEEIDYATGLIISEYKGLNVVSHGGAFVGFRAELMRFPDEKTSIAIFANRADANPSRKARQVADVLFADKLEEPSSDPGTEEEDKIGTGDPEYTTAQIEGSYELEPGVVADITAKGDTLNVLQNWNQSEYPILRKEGNVFVITGQPIEFIFTDLEDDKTMTLTVLQGGSTFTAKRKDPIDLSSINLTDYVGSFYSAELLANYDFSIVDEELKLKVGSREFTCTSADIDIVTCQMGTIQFKRVGDNVIGLELDSGRVINVQFEKVD